MKIIVVVCLILTASSLTGQVEHAPTVAQCHADLRLWWAENRTTIESLSAGTLDERRREMDACSSVLEGNEASDSRALRHVYDGHLARRMEDFLTRHCLLGQFTQEDTKGAR